MNIAAPAALRRRSSATAASATPRHGARGATRRSCRWTPRAPSTASTPTRTRGALPQYKCPKGPCCRRTSPTQCTGRPVLRTCPVGLPPPAPSTRRRGRRRFLPSGTRHGRPRSTASCRAGAAGSYRAAHGTCGHAPLRRAGRAPPVPTERHTARAATLHCVVPGGRRRFLPSGTRHGRPRSTASCRAGAAGSYRAAHGTCGHAPLRRAGRAPPVPTERHTARAATLHCVVPGGRRRFLPSGTRHGRPRSTASCRAGAAGSYFPPPAAGLSGAGGGGGRGLGQRGTVINGVPGLCSPPRPLAVATEGVAMLHVPEHPVRSVVCTHCTPTAKDALEGKRPQRRSQRRLDGRSEAVAKAVGGGYCRLHTPLKLALAVRAAVAGHRLSALDTGCAHGVVFRPEALVRTELCGPHAPPCHPLFRQHAAPDAREQLCDTPQRVAGSLFAGTGHPGTACSTGARGSPVPVPGGREALRIRRSVAGSGAGTALPPRGASTAAPTCAAAPASGRASVAASCPAPPPPPKGLKSLGGGRWGQGLA